VTAKIFKTGNSMALRLPSKLNPKVGEVSVEVQGDAWIVRPIKARKWPDGFFRKIRISEPAFARPNQGAHRPVEL
jgi:virulence-associated protein VagC